MAATTTLTLTEFLLARIAEDEAWGRRDEADVTGPPNGMLIGGRMVHPGSRVLAECEAKRQIVADLTEELRDAEAHGDRHDAACATHYLRLLSLPYADHPDYMQEWKP